MILVNINRTYPEAAEQIAAVNEDASRDIATMKAVVQPLIDGSRRWWPMLTPRYLEEHGDYLAAIADHRIVGVFRVTGTSIEMVGDVRKVVFDVEIAPEAAHHIGAPTPGGPWRKGESRGTRSVVTPGDFLPVSQMTEHDVEVYYSRLHTMAVAYTEGRTWEVKPEQGPTPYSSGDTSYRHAGTVGDVEVRVYPDGVVGVRVPQGHRVMVETVTR